MSQRGDRGEGHARGRPGRSDGFGGHRGPGVGSWGPSGQSSLSFNCSAWEPDNAHSGHHEVVSQQVHHTAGSQPASAPGHLHTPAPPPQHVPVVPVPRPQHHGQPSKSISSQFACMDIKGIPQFLARTSTAHLDLDERKRNQALAEELKAASSTPVHQLDLKQQPLQHQPNKFFGPRNNTIEITHHAEVHQELKLGMRMYSSRQRALLNLTPQSQPVGSYSQIPRSGSHASNRWQQKGLVPSPVTPMQIMHKANKKYVVGEVSNLEEVKQRQLNAILNKLTPRNFVKLFRKVEEVNIDNVATLSWFVSRVFHRVLVEQSFCEIYAKFCFQLALTLPDFREGTERITFRRLLLNYCQEVFERGERKEAKAGKVEEGEIKQTKEEEEERAIHARRCKLGNIRLIGELYKNRMLTERIMHDCIKKLIGDFHNPDEENTEALCKLMSTIGEMIDHPKAKENMDAYFEIMQKLSTNQKLSFRVRFLLRDSIDLRKNKWQQRCKMI